MSKLTNDFVSYSSQLLYHNNLYALLAYNICKYYFMADNSRE